MGRKVSVIVFTVILGLVWGVVCNVTGQSTSPDGFKLLGFSVTPTQLNVGETVNIVFKLKNVTSEPITFSSHHGMFVGARWNSTTDDNNRDFGHRHKGTVVQPGGEIGLKIKKTLDAPGTWRF